MLESIKLDIIKEIEILNETDFNSETKRYEDNIKNAKKILTIVNVHTKVRIGLSF